MALLWCPLLCLLFPRYSLFVLRLFSACFVGFCFEWFLVVLRFSLYLSCFILPYFVLLRLSCAEASLKYRASRSLTKTGFFVGFMLALFCFFFLSRFSASFLIGFFFIFEGFGRPSWHRKSIFGKLFGTFFWHPHFGAFFA